MRDGWMMAGGRRLFKGKGKGWLEKRTSNVLAANRSMREVLEVAMCIFKLYEVRKWSLVFS